MAVPRKIWKAFTTAPSPSIFFKKWMKWFFGFKWVKTVDPLLLNVDREDVTLSIDIGSLYRRIKELESQLEAQWSDMPFIGRNNSGDIEINAGTVNLSMGGYEDGTGLSTDVSAYDSAAANSTYYFVKVRYVEAITSLPTATIYSTIQTSTTKPEFMNLYGEAGYIWQNVIIGKTDASGNWTQLYSGGDIHLWDARLRAGTLLTWNPTGSVQMLNLQYPSGSINSETVTVGASVDSDIYFHCNADGDGALKLNTTPPNATYFVYYKVGHVETDSAGDLTQLLDYTGCQLFPRRGKSQQLTIDGTTMDFTGGFYTGTV